MSKFKQLPLTTAVIGALFATTAYANTDAPEVDLGTQQVVVDRQGAKVKTNVVTESMKSERTENDLRGLLKEEPAIEFGGGNGTSQYIAIRGMGQNSIDVKIDNAYSDSQILYHQGRFMLDPALVKVVAVQKGAGSASAGIGATNGAIVAKTLDAKDLLEKTDKDYGLKVTAGYNSNDGHEYGATAFAKAGNFDFLLSGNRINEDNYEAGKGYKNSANSSKATDSALDKIGYLAKVGVDLGNHRFVLGHYHDEHKGTRPIREEFDMGDSLLTTTGLNYWQRKGGLVQGDATGATDERSGKPLYYVLDAKGNKVLRNQAVYRENKMTNTNLEWTATDLGLVEEATANVYRMKNERYSSDDTASGYAGNMPGATTTTITTTGANLNLDWKAGESAILKTGVNYRHQEVEPYNQLKETDLVEKKVNGQTVEVPFGVKLVNPEKTDVTGYIEAIGDIGNVTATAGVRYDYFEFTAMDGKKVSDAQLNPSLGLIWQATPSLSFNANHNYATRSPRLYDALLSHGRRGIISIADGTKAERARNTEVGFNFNHTFANNSSLALNGSYFWQKINDAVVNPQNRHGSDGVKEIANAGHITNQGYELGATYKIGGFTAKVGVADSDPKFEGIIVDPKSTSDLNPEFGAKIGRTWTSSLAYRFAQPNLEIGVRNRTVEKSDKALRQDIAPQNREGYSVTDVFANWKPYGNDKMNVNLAVNNITDEFYRPHSQRAGGGLPAVGRDYRVGVNFTF